MPLAGSDANSGIWLTIRVFSRSLMVIASEESGAFGERTRPSLQTGSILITSVGRRTAAEVVRPAVARTLVALFYLSKQDHTL